jgi:hypothetical protein
MRKTLLQLGVAIFVTLTTAGLVVQFANHAFAQAQPDCAKCKD